MGFAAVCSVQICLWRRVCEGETIGRGDSSRAHSSCQPGSGPSLSFPPRAPPSLLFPLWWIPSRDLKRRAFEHLRLQGAFCGVDVPPPPRKPRLTKPVTELKKGIGGKGKGSARGKPIGGKGDARFIELPFPRWVVPSHNRRTKQQSVKQTAATAKQYPSAGFRHAF